MSMSICYRLARPEDAAAIGLLARRVTRRWILPEQPASAAAAILAGMGTRVIRKKILAGQRFHLAWQEGEPLVGVAAMRDDFRLFQFFVSTRLQGHGIARQLWQRVMRDAVRRAGTRRFTLNSSLVAEPVYARLGFLPSGPVTVASNGITTRPMHIDLP